LCPVFEQNKNQFYSLTLTLSPRARENQLNRTASLRSAPNILQGTASRSESSLTLPSPQGQGKTNSIERHPCEAHRDHEVQTSCARTLSQRLTLPAESLLYRKYLFLFSQIFYHKSTLISQNHMENKSYGQLFIRFFRKIYYYLFSLWKNFIYSIILFVTDQAKRVRQIWYTDK
ncbi:MAG TPA: hypothetical protein PLG96_06880, partial [Flexilinea sp.]|nr:hypothetical protein [Flexilinea sp.]